MHDLVNAAFGQQAEARLIDDLNAAGDLVLALVAEDAGLVVGHVALSRLKSPDRAVALAPLSVVPQAQGRGIGSALIREALAQARDMGEFIVFVLGDPAYYQRFGFTRAAATDFPCVYAGPFFMACLLADRPVAGTEVIYADAFANL